MPPGRPSPTQVIAPASKWASAFGPENASHTTYAVVTGITERGFKYRYDARIDLGPRYGWYQEGEAFTDQGWTSLAPGIAKTPGDTKPVGVVAQIRRWCRAS